ncbi:MAG TPA: dethiobiotin synthase [Micromonosporaceae bacterium]|nr:dethiobiotin synthase [Micromonosporaceae bacterium]
MSVLVLSGTDTEVGKTVVAAAVAALALSARRKVAILKPVQTGVGPDDPGDIDEIVRLAGDVTRRELARFPDPLAPATAARRLGRPAVRPADIAAAAVELNRTHGLVIIEGAGGLLVRFDDEGGTIADVAWALGAPVLVVARAGLGTLNATALTTEALRRRGVACAGVVVGSWPAQPDLAARHNLEDLPIVAEAPLAGVLPAGAAGLDRAEFLNIARRSLGPAFGGEFDAEGFADDQLRAG